MSNHDMELAQAIKEHKVARENWKKDLSVGMVILASVVVPLALDLNLNGGLTNLSIVSAGFFAIGLFLFSDGPYFYKKTAQLKARIDALSK